MIHSEQFRVLFEHVEPDFRNTILDAGANGLKVKECVCQVYSGAGVGVLCENVILSKYQTQMLQHCVFKIYVVVVVVVV